MINVTANTAARDSVIRRAEEEKRLKKLEDQMSWIIARYAEAGDNPKIEKHDIQIACLRKQVLDLEGKKSYTDIEDQERMRGPDTDDTPTSYGGTDK
tara:strand:+ start:270 stop:560 length:291 start_codon:yes stop_codon:yes gene_type:complete